jgi:hypothetical protein
VERLDRLMAQQAEREAARARAAQQAQSRHREGCRPAASPVAVNHQHAVRRSEPALSR